jgi:hypothetical protein
MGSHCKPHKHKKATR